jgi:hypothetical protein
VRAVPDRYRETLNAFVAPVANEADAVAKDPGALQVAEAVYEAFWDIGTEGDAAMPLGRHRGRRAGECPRRAGGLA